MISLQKFDGSWSSKAVLTFIAVKDEKLGEITDVKIEILLTYLVILWMEKNPQKQYSLLIKKAKSWLKKAMEDAAVDERKLEKFNLYV